MTSFPAKKEDTTSSNFTNPAKITRESAWTCRLPRDLMSEILGHIIQSRAMCTLAALQSTSSAMYTLVTPYLYRNLDIHEYQVFRLLREFRHCSDFRLFIEPVPPHDHVLDLTLAHRLRNNFSYTRTITLEMQRCSSNAHELDDFKNLQTALTVFQYPSLWPNLQRTEINMVMKSPDDNSAQFRYRFAVPLALMSGHLMKYLVIKLPVVQFEPPGDDEGYQEMKAALEEEFMNAWADFCETIQSERIELVNPGTPFMNRPRATESLTIRFHEQMTAIEDRVGEITAHSSTDIIKIIDMFQGPTPSHPWTTLDLPNQEDFQHMMSDRLMNGNRKDLKVGLVPASEVESRLFGVHSRRKTLQSFSRMRCPRHRSGTWYSSDNAERDITMGE